MAKPLHLKNIILSERSQAYFKLIKESLQSDNDDASDDEVVNYAFETLANLEAIVDDPADFIEGFVNGSIKIVRIKPKQFDDGSQSGKNSGS